MTMSYYDRVYLAERVVERLAENYFNDYVWGK